jgi:hypothetical protein
MASPSLTLTMTNIFEDAMVPHFWSSSLSSQLFYHQEQNENHCEGWSSCKALDLYSGSMQLESGLLPILTGAPHH